MNCRALLAALALTLTPATVSAQRAACVPGNPLYDRGDYRCFGERPVPTRARAAVRARVEAARYLSGSDLPAHLREALEDHFRDLAPSLSAELPSLVDGDGELHTPEVRLAVVLLPSGSVGRVRVLTRHVDPLDRRIAQSLAAAVSEGEGMPTGGAELEAVVRLRPRLDYTRWRPLRPTPCCVDDAE
jgi:hypothetical protein